MERVLIDLDEWYVWFSVEQVFYKEHIRDQMIYCVLLDYSRQMLKFIQAHLQTCTRLYIDEFALAMRVWARFMLYMISITCTLGAQCTLDAPVYRKSKSIWDKHLFFPSKS